MYQYPCPLEDSFLEQVGRLSVLQIGRQRVEEFTRFVFQVFAARIGRRQGWNPEPEELDHMIAEELGYFPEGVYIAIALADGSLVAGFRMVRWHAGAKFPTETVFGLCVEEIARSRQVSPDRIWHASQMVIDNQTLAMSNFPVSIHQLIMELLREHVFRAMYQLGAEYWLYEGDPLVTRRFNRQGIISEPLSPLRDYVGKTYACLVDLKACFRQPWFRPEPLESQERSEFLR